MAKEQVLLVERDVRALRTLKVSLEQAGYAVTTARDGKEALAKMELSTPALVITATDLPKLDGYGLVKRMKEHSGWARIPVIFMVVAASIEDKIRALELGVEEHLSKPVFKKELVARVRVAIAKRVHEELSESVLSTRVRGSLSDMAVIDLLESLEQGGHTGVVHLESDAGRTGEVFFQDGDICDAAHKSLRGEEAVFRMICWVDGTFEVEPCEVDMEDVVAENARTLLEAAVRHAAEYNRLVAVLPSVDAVMEVDSGELLARMNEIPEQLNGILELFDGKRDVLDIIDDSPFDDLSTLLTVGKLFQEGLLIEMKEGPSGLYGSHSERPLSGQPTVPEEPEDEEDDGWDFPESSAPSPEPEEPEESEEPESEEPESEEPESEEPESEEPESEAPIESKPRPPRPSRRGRADAPRAGRSGAKTPIAGAILEDDDDGAPGTPRGGRIVSEPPPAESEATAESSAPSAESAPPPESAPPEESEAPPDHEPPAPSEPPAKKPSKKKRKPEEKSKPKRKKTKKRPAQSEPPASGPKALSESGVSAGFFASMAPPEPAPISEIIDEPVYLTAEQVARGQRLKKIVGVGFGVLGGLLLFWWITRPATDTGTGGTSTPATVSASASALASASTTASAATSAVPSPSASAAADGGGGGGGGDDGDGGSDGAGGAGVGVGADVAAIVKSDKPLPEVDDPLKQAMSKLNRGRIREAIPFAKAAIKKEPDNADAYMALVWAYENIGKRDLMRDVSHVCFHNAKKGKYKALCREKKKKKKK